MALFSGTISWNSVRAFVSRLYSGISSGAKAGCCYDHQPCCICRNLVQTKRAWVLGCHFAVTADGGLLRCESVALLFCCWCRWEWACIYLYAEEGKPPLLVSPHPLLLLSNPFSPGCIRQLHQLFCTSAVAMVDHGFASFPQNMEVIQADNVCAFIELEEKRWIKSLLWLCQDCHFICLVMEMLFSISNYDINLRCPLTQV